MGDITAIVNVYKRPHTLDKQLTAIFNQSVPPTNVFIWNQGNPIDLTKYKLDPRIRVFDNSHNFGVWSRFLIGFLASTQYVCVFDDDTIPGQRWFENCLNTMEEEEALLGTIGVIFENDRVYTHLKRYGWDGNSDVKKAVDIVGHSWFFKKDWLSYFVREPPQVHERISSGEDIHFACMLQKYANIPVYVPPHPSSDKSLWGSMPDTAWGYGCDGNSETGKFTSLDLTYRQYIERGFRILVNRHCSYKSDFIYFLQMIRERTPFAVIRPADGEYAILQNHTLTNIDDWSFQSGGRLSKDLDNAIRKARVSHAHIGIPCDTDNIDMAKWYINTYNLHPLYTTFANLFVNGNWESWVSFLEKEHIPFTYIGSGTCATKFAVQKYIKVDPYLVNNWDTEAENTHSLIFSEIMNVKGAIFMFSAGPLSKILIADAWEKNPHNIYIDIGSSLDLFFKGTTNRCYTNPSHELCVRDYVFTEHTVQI